LETHASFDVFQFGLGERAAVGVGRGVALPDVVGVPTTLDGEAEFEGVPGSYLGSTSFRYRGKRNSG
jgi:hypothetical protein